MPRAHEELGVDHAGEPAEPASAGNSVPGRRRRSDGTTRNRWPRSVTVEIPASLDPTAVERAVCAHVADLARIAQVKDLVQEANAPMPPALLAAVAEQERRWRDIERDYGLLSGTDVATLSGSTAHNRSEYASNLRTRRRVLAALRRGRYAYPAFQFAESGRVHPAVPAVIDVMVPQGWDAESIIFWMVSPNGYLGGDPPAQRLADTEIVVDAAINAAEAGR